MNALFARLFLAITPDRLNRFFQAVTFGCGAFLTAATGFTPPLSAWLLLLFGLLSAVSSAWSKRLAFAAKPYTVLDVIGWSAASVVQLLPGALGEAHITLPRTAALLMAVAGTAVAMATHGPALGAPGSAS